MRQRRRENSLQGGPLRPLPRPVGRCRGVYSGVEVCTTQVYALAGRCRVYSQVQRRQASRCTVQLENVLESHLPCLRCTFAPQLGLIQHAQLFEQEEGEDFRRKTKKGLPAKIGTVRTSKDFGGGEIIALALSGRRWRLTDRDSNSANEERVQSSTLQINFQFSTLQFNFQSSTLQLNFQFSIYQEKRTNNQIQLAQLCVTI